MPVYEYNCNKEAGGCGHSFEITQKFSDPTKRKCPKCKKLKLKRLFGVPGLAFKGSGFYVNDYGKGSAMNID